jgi:beta-glucanase (GH16 family)
MALSTPAGYSASDLVFQESFSGTTLNSAWHTYVTSNAAHGWPWNDNGSGGSYGGQYDADYDMPSQVSVSNGTLNLTAIQQPVNGIINGSTPHTYPVTSGAVSSYGNFEFNGGYLQISMKAPSGDGAWPALWLLPGKGAGSSGDNFELDIQEGGFIDNGVPANRAFSWHLHTPQGWFGGTIDAGFDLTAGFHTYGINWLPGQSITWYLDGKQMAQLTSAQATIPSEPMELIMNNGVANTNATGWHSTLDSSTPYSMQMQVDEIQLYQKAGTGETVTGANVTPTTPPTVTPTVTLATASPATGVEHAGDTVTLTLGFNEAVNVTGTPTLSLNDGGTATYVSGSGTSSLTFRTTVASTDSNTSALAITGVNLPSGASIKDASGTAANLSGAVKTFTGLQIDPVLPAVTQATASPATGIEHAGDTVTLTLGFNEAVNVTGTPTLSLNDGGTATYVGGSGTSSLTFRTTVASTDSSTSALAITGVNLPSGASIKDAGGVAANLSGAVKTFTGLQVDPTLPAVTQATASPATGVEHAGDTVTLTLGFNEAVNVTGTPTLSLNDGGTATYVGGSGTTSLTFRTTVASTDSDTSALAITGVNLPSGAGIKDASGTAANLSGAVKTFAGLQIDPVLPAVTQATASPATGVAQVGDTVTLTLAFNEAVTVSGTPTLSLNDGDVATFVGGSGTNALTFRTTVASTDTSTSALAITGVNLPSGASIKDAGGVAANLSAAVTTFSGLQIDPPTSTPTPAPTPTPTPTPTPASATAPTLTIADTSIDVTAGSTVDLGVSVSTTDSNDVITVNIKGLPKYETITDNLDGRTYRGRNITLTEAQVESGLVLRSNYRGSDHPVATLSLTATATDPTTGTVANSATATLTVTDPPATATATSAASAHSGFALLSQYLAGGFEGGQVDRGLIAAAAQQIATWHSELSLARPH